MKPSLKFVSTPLYWQTYDKTYAKPKLTISQFVLQGESKRLYRQFMKLTRLVEDKDQRKGLRIWIRDDFKINKTLTDEVRIWPIEIIAT